MSIEGLNVVLEKEPVVGTPAARRLLEDPRDVESMYLRHVRSYVPLGRAAEAGEDQMSVTQYEHRLIQMVKEAKAPKGYITADFGYGKTSTCAFLWHRCKEANLLAVPPFQIEALDHLLLGTYGWVKHCLAGTRPTLIDRATEIYDKYKIATIERFAKGNADIMAVLDEEYRAGRYKLELNATDYVHFFEEMTNLALEAGYAGLVVLVDEVQQYIDPAIKAGVRDPIAPLFDLVQALVTRKGHLKFGLVFSLPKKELGVINDQRGDLIQRLKMDQLALDLGAIYDRAFARRLWDELSEQWDFKAESPRIVATEALDALGEISARDDLANGPRTVVNVFKVMAARYLDADGKTKPYSPLDLIDDFLSGQISFDGMSRIQQAVNSASSSRIVKGHPERERAIRLLAAFPTEGATRPILEKYGLATIADDLANLAQGELVIFVGGGFDTLGAETPIGMTLRGLEPVTTNVDWLQMTVREFTRTYFENNDLVNQRPAKGFIALLRARVFTSPNWKVLEEREARFTQNAGLVLEGSFQNTRRKYPERLVHVRILLEGETARSESLAQLHPGGDMGLDFVLERHLDKDEGERRTFPGRLELTHAHNAVRFSLNMMHRDSSEIYRDLHSTLQPVVNPWKLTPLLMLSLHQYLEEKRASNLIPKGDDPFVKDNFQPMLLDHCVEELFSGSLGAEVAASGVRIVEDTFRKLCERLLPDYFTLMVNDQWRNALKDYQTALERLPTVYEKRGLANFGSTKDDLASKFNRSNTALDNFIQIFGDLIEVLEKWQGGQQGVVRFKMHPLEEHILKLLGKARDTVTAKIGSHSQNLHTLATAGIYSLSKKLGYRDREIDEVLILMEKRELITRDPRRGLLIEAPHTAPSLAQYRDALNSQQSRLEILLGLFPDDPQLTGWQKQHSAMLVELSNTASKLTDQVLTSRVRTLSAYEVQINAFMESRYNDLSKQVNELLHNLTPFDLTRYAALNHVASGALFSDQLNQTRVDLLKDLNRLKSSDEQLRDGSMRLATDLGSATRSDQILQRIIKDWGSIRNQFQVLQRDLQQFTVVYNSYSETVTLLETATVLQNTIFELGEPAEHLKGSLDAWSTDIRGQISSRKRNALDNVVSWKERFAEIRREVDAVRKAAIETFNTSQEGYRQELSHNMGIPQDQLFSPVIYNPLDPQGTYERLYVGVRDTISRLVDRLRIATDRIQTEIQQAQSSTSLDTLLETDKVDLSQRFEEVLSQLGIVRSGMDQLAAIDLDTIRQAGQPGTNASFASMLEVSVSIRTILNAALQQTRDLTQRLGETALTPDETRVYEAVCQLTSGLDGDIDVAQLLMSSTGQQFSRDVLWNLLERLYDKRRLHVRLRTVGGN